MTTKESIVDEYDTGYEQYARSIVRACRSRDFQKTLLKTQYLKDCF